MTKQARPFCCPEPTCQPIFAHNLYSPPVPGESFICFGRMSRPVEFTYDGSEHVNDLNHCDYTPLKGIIRWQENEDDWIAVIKTFKRALEKLNAHKSITKGSTEGGRRRPKATT